MKIIRTKFNKEGDMIYISHLDLQQLLQRAFRRAEIDLVHSQGFNPHPKISYGNALALGTESQGEYVDVEIEEDLSVEEYLNRMNAQLPQGIKFIEAKEIDKQEPSLASVIEYGEYIFTIETEKTLTKEYVKSKILEFMSQDEIMITKKNKKGKIVEYTAKEGYEILKELVETDEGSHYLGEVALVDHFSPISQSNQIFYETLFDENAACHLAFGRAYESCVKDADKYSEEELEKIGVNNSVIHVDFMIGTSDLEITGINKNNETVQIFSNGNWIF